MSATTAWRSRLRPNAVLARELRQRMRGRWAPIVLVLYLGLLGLVMHITHAGVTRLSDFNAFVAGNASVGRTMFHWLLFFMLFLVCFAVPGITAGAIAGERERQTLVPLQVTLLTPWSLVVGKLLSSLAFLVLLVIATVPLIGVSFIFGGVGPGEVLRGIAMLLLSTLAIACVALAASSMFRRTAAATAMSYAFTLLLLFGTFIAYGAQTVVTGGAGVRHQPQTALWANPIMATASVLSDRNNVFDVGNSPFALAQALIRFHEEPTVLQEEVLDGAAELDVAPPDGSRRTPILRFWMKSAMTYAVICAIALLVATRRVRTPADTE